MLNFRTRVDGERILLSSVAGGLKLTMPHHRTSATRDEAKRDLFSYVEGFYNRPRLHSDLDYRTPDQAERQAANLA